MKVLFWIAAVLNIIATAFIFQGFVNVYYRNFNGGPASSSGSIKYVLIVAVLILIVGLTSYFLGRFKLAAIIMGLPIVLLFLYLLVMLVLPWLSGERMN